MSRARIWRPSKASKFVWHTVNTRTLHFIIAIMGHKLVVRSRRATREFLGPFQEGCACQQEGCNYGPQVKIRIIIVYLGPGCGYSHKWAIGQLNRTPRP